MRSPLTLALLATLSPIVLSLDLLCRSTYLELKAGVQYTLTLWILTSEAGATVRTEVLHKHCSSSPASCRDQSALAMMGSSPSGFVMTHAPAALNTWEQVTHTFIPSESVDVLINIGHNGQSGTTAYFDDVCIRVDASWA